MRTLAIEGGQIGDAARDASGVRVFKGLPFAAPPLGPLRWKPPAAVPPWPGIRETHRYADPCPQPALVSDGVEPPDRTSEDCLYLNVYTPALAPHERLPVLLWLHGGAFLVGAARDNDGTGLARRGIVVVTAAYRLGVFGFLAHPALGAESPHAASGNYGLMDQVAALRWIRRNIGLFGGDPSCVTIGGSSSGATSVNILMCSPLAKGLFQRAIGQSGSAMPSTGLGDGSPHPRAAEEEKGERFVQQLAVSTLQDLRRLPAEALVAAGGSRWETWAWNACVDGWLLPDSVPERFAQAQQQDVPLLVGWNSNEGASLARDAFGDDGAPLRPQLESAFGQASRSLLALYGCDSPAFDERGKVALAGDGFIAFPTWSWASAQTRTGGSPVFLYLFDVAPPIPVNWARRKSMLGAPGAYHGALQPYLFETFDRMPDWEFSDHDRRLGACIADYWANFIRGADPNDATHPQWDRFVPTAPRKMYFRSTGAASQADGDDTRFRALASIFSSAPGALRYRGMRVRQVMP